MSAVAFDEAEQRPVDLTFLLLAATFLSSLVTCNLIANKFVSVDLGFKVFTLSAGVLPYPITFLVTDLLSEIYGRRRASRVVWSGFAASMFALLAIWLGGNWHAIAGSPVDDDTYLAAFGNSWRVIGASMTAYLVAQFCDVRLFHFWKRLTDGRHLWLRNNASTIVSQLLDTTLVVLVLFVGREGWSAERMAAVIFDGWVFKTMVALGDTPLFYFGAWYLRRVAARPL
ncbi:MAG TPA: VUT family protein [bacterium]|nr:VUT family protein [bacterium]